MSVERQRAVLIGFVENLEFPNFFQRSTISSDEDPKRYYSSNPIENLKLGPEAIIKNDFIDNLSKRKVIAQINRSTDVLGLVAKILDEFIDKGWLKSRNCYTAQETLKNHKQTNIIAINNLSSYIAIRKKEGNFHGLSYFNQKFQSKDVKLQAAKLLLLFLKDENDPISVESEDDKKQIIKAMRQGRLGRIADSGDGKTLITQFEEQLDVNSLNYSKI